MGSLCDDLSENGSTDVGEANMFFSHVWTDKFWNSVDAVLQLIEECGAAALQTTYIWFDVFSTSQHTSIDRPSSWWMDTFKNTIAKMGRLAMVLNPWDNPAALQRAWCVLELFSCASTGGCFEVAMPPAERERFLRCNRIPGLFDKMLSQINSRDATCSRESDRVSANVFRRVSGVDLFYDVEQCSSGAHYGCSRTERRLCRHGQHASPHSGRVVQGPAATHRCVCIIVKIC
jgi:hypothetical protein